MNDFHFTFWTPGHALSGDGHTFGCAAHGFAAANLWRGPAEAAVAGWSDAPTRNLYRNLAQRDDGKDYGLEGAVLAGTYAAVLARLERLAWKPTAAIILFAHASGIDEFLRQWRNWFPGVPVAGGGAALGAGQTVGELLPAAADVAVLLIRDGQWRVDTLNVHDRTGRIFEFRASGPRTITHLRDRDASWTPAATGFRVLQAAHGRAATDCESLTLCDAGGRNIHCRFDGEVLHTGADLPGDGRLELRKVSRADAAQRLAEFCTVPNALVFGCAGLRSLLDAPLPVASGALVGFLFGELITLEGRPQFGNLMAARLTPEP